MAPRPLSFLYSSSSPAQQPALAPALPFSALDAAPALSSSSSSSTHGASHPPPSSGAWVVPVSPASSSGHSHHHAHSLDRAHTALHLGHHHPPPVPQAAFAGPPHGRSLSLSRRRDPPASPPALTSRSYRQAHDLERGSLFPAPASPSSLGAAAPALPPQPALASTSSSSNSLDPFSAQLAQPQGHRQTRSVGRAPSLSHLGSPASTVPPPPLSSRARASSNAASMLASPSSSDAQGRPRESSTSRAMAYSPLPPPANAVQDQVMTPYGSVGSTGLSALAYRASPGAPGEAGDAGTPMRRGISYDGAAGSRASTSSSLIPGTYTPSTVSSQSLQAGAAGGGGRDAYSPMVGVQHSGSASASTSASASSPRLLPTAPSPSRPYSPSHYAAQQQQQQQHHPTSLSPGGFASALPPQQQQPPPPSSFYPQHIAQSYTGASSSAAGGASPLLPPSAPPSAGGPSHGHHPQQQHQQPSLQRAASLSSHHHSHSYSHAANPSTPFYSPIGSHSTSTTDLRNLSLGSSSAAAPSQQQQPRRRKKGLMRVGDVSEVERAGVTRGGQPKGRRADPAGGFVGPLKALTTSLPETYHLVNPAFVYETSRNPRRVLTKPSKPASNDGFDNEDSDYILYVNDVLGPEDKDRYLILDVLGQGTFGQVVKCQNMKTHEIVAVKVVKNKPAYFQQSMMEVTILELINNQWDKDDEHHMLRLKDTFIHHSHLCLVFELLSNNLYELIKQNSFRGLSTSLVRVFTAQLLDALSVLNEAKIIHCDLKPENILLKSLQSPTIKVIDFGSACHEKQTVYTYIQSRFYRSPEVILSLPYSSMIDMWSLGCICVELFLGLPLFPGTSEFNQITRIVEMLGMPPDPMLDKGKQTSHFFETFADEYGRRRYRLKSLERYSQEFKVQEQPSKKYFSASTLPEIIKQYPIVRKGLKEAEVDKEMRNRIAFIDFVQGLLHLDPEQRWTPQQARLHPFVLGEPLLAPFVPPPRHLVSKGAAPSPTEIAAAKQQQQHQAAQAAQQQAQRQQALRHQSYGAMPPPTAQGQPRQGYQPHLQQQQGYGLTQQQQQQRGSNNPYGIDAGQAQAYAVQQQARQAAQQPSLYGAAAGGFAPRTAPPTALGGGPAPAGVANPPAVHHQYGVGRQRSGTHGAHDALPPALQKLGHELTAGLGAGQSITPVLRREDQWQAWEQQYGSGAGGVARRVSVSGRHPHLNLLQEQAESGLHSWNSPVRAKPPPSQPPAALYSPAQGGPAGYYASPLQPQASQFSIVVDPSQPGASGSARPQSDLFDPIGGIAPPPLAYAAGNPSARYAPYPGSAPAPPPGAGIPLSSAPPALDASPPSAFDVFGASPAHPQQPPHPAAGAMGGGHDPLAQYQPLQPYASPSLGRGAGGNGAAYGQQGQGQQPRGLW
ncbi:uncharacterized protein JCM10292_003453 [Rhodotorula paludigena]|uniref:uncharacterized protein n=1 Tax=Rhodotorula paludigena TaxID=86838 RepID=UPI00317A76DD